MAIAVAGGLQKCERAGSNGKNRAQREACNLVSDEEVMCDWERITGGEDLSCGEGVRWEDARTWWC